MTGCLSAFQHLTPSLMTQFAKETLPISLEEEMRRSYLDYAMSVIVGRALPDARDGLKPVHRRVLFAMHELNNDWNRPYKKSARIVGDVIGKYHPHGDSAVYDTIVRMAQDFSLRHMLVDGQGNFGSVDGDNAAAMRYTEIRLSKIAHEMLADIDKETVNFGPNYDGSEKEPLVLPSRLPNLLVNGSSGIAVGMATNIPPHNLNEVVDACLHLLKQPEATIDELMEIIPAPDFPTAGIIYGINGVKDGYRTGRGRVIMRARTHFEDIGKGDRQAIIVDEIPYQVNKSRLIERMAELVRDKKLEGVKAVQTLSRLNRTFPGKESTFVLDFVNDPLDVLEEFQKYFETATLDTVSDPNLVYDLFHKLKATGIFTWSEVEAFSDAYFDPKRGAQALPGYIKPAVERFTKRYKLASEAVRECRQMLKRIEREGGSATDKVNAERRVKEATEARGELDLFKKDLNSYVRFYEFVSQITAFDDESLERLCVFARHLLPMLAMFPQVVVTLVVHLQGAVIQAPVGVAAEVAHGIGAAEHLGPLLLQLLARGDVRQGPATAEHGTDKGPVGPPKGKAQLNQCPLDGELQQALLLPAELHRQRHRSIKGRGLVRLAIFAQQLHVHRIAGAKGVIELARAGLVADGLDPPELGQVHLVGQLRKLPLYLAAFHRLGGFARGDRGQGHFVALEPHPHHPLAIEEGAGPDGRYRRQGQGVACLAA